MSGTVTSGRKVFKDTAGANTYNIGADATRVTISGKMTAGDIINLEGLASEYTASAVGRTITLKSATQTVTFQLSNAAGTASVRFLDGDLTALFATKGGATLGGVKLTRKAVEIDDSKLGTTDAAQVDFTGGAATGGGSTGGGSTGSTFTLTTGADTASGNVSGLIDQATPANSTFNASDVMIGGSGVQTLTVTSAGAPTGLGSADIQGYEILNWRATANTGTVALATANIAGLTEFNANRGTGTVTVTGLNKGAAYGLVGDGAVQLGAQNATYAATATEAILNIKGGVGPSGTTAPTVTIGGTATKSITINSSGAANKIGALDLDTNTGGTLITDATINATTKLTTGAITAAALKTVKATGSGAIDLDSGTTALATTVTTVDASGNSGGVSVKLGAVTSSFTGGSGSDLVNISGLAAFSSTGKLAGGDGTDTLQIDDDSATIFTTAALKNISGFETLRVTTGGTKTVDFSSLKGLTGLEIGAATSAVINKLGASTPVKVIGNQTTNLTLNVKDDTLPTSMTDSVTLTLQKDGTASATSIVTVANLTATGLETVNIVSNGVVGNDETVTTDDNTISSLLGLASSNVTTINLSGASDLNITTGAVDKTMNINASSLTGNLTITAAGVTNTAVMGITGGSGKDTITGTTNADILKGGAGADTITGGAGGDNIDGGIGADTYRFVLATDSQATALTATDTYTVTTGDIFDDTGTALTAGTYTAGTQTTLAINSAANLLSALTEVSRAGTTALTTNAGYLITITDSTSTYNGTYLVVEDGSTGGAVDANDFVVKLVGATSSSTLTAAGGNLVLTV
jgi:RTX calcium-binding nonapeptide repeat (4 copies)